MPQSLRAAASGTGDAAGPVRKETLVLRIRCVVLASRFAVARAEVEGVADE